jgi:hypothetical protein
MIDPLLVHDVLVADGASLWCDTLPIALSATAGYTAGPLRMGSFYRAYEGVVSQTKLSRMKDHHIPALPSGRSILVGILSTDD